MHHRRIFQLGIVRKFREVLAQVQRHLGADFGLLPVARLFSVVWAPDFGPAQAPLVASVGGFWVRVVWREGLACPTRWRAF
jgi:hypothetical protein